MGYAEAIEAAGGRIKEFKTFGSYQGTFMALLNDGRIIEGSYGSCSGCDAFEAEFDYDSEDQPDYKKRLAEFGAGYLNSACPLEQMIDIYKKKAEGEYAWDDDKEILEWLENIK